MEELIKLIEKFLNGGKKTSFEGWPEVTQNELDELNLIISGIIELKYATDCDGDFPVTFFLIDKAKERVLYPAVVPHRHEKPGMDHELVRRLSIGLASIANDINTEVTIEVLKNKK